MNNMILSGLDQILPLEGLEKELKDLEELIEDCVAEGNPEPAETKLLEINSKARTEGISNAKYLYMMSFAWDKFPQSKHQTFEQRVEEKFGYVKATTNRYIKVMEMLVSGDVPQEYIPRLQILPIGSLIKISACWKQGWEIEPHHWMMLSRAPDTATVGKIIRETIKKVEPKKGALNIEWHEGDSKAVGWKDGKPHNIYLQYDTEDPVCLQMLERWFGDGKAIEK
jgi:hypothetical protein